MIMPEIHRENRHRADTAQRKTCQTAKKPDMNNNSFPGPEICESGPWKVPVLRSLLVELPIIGISGGCVAMRKPEREQRCFWRSWN